MTKTTVHLHWGWQVGPKLLQGVTEGISLCNRTVPRAELTAFADDTNCAACLERMKNPPKDRGERPMLNAKARWR